MDRQKAISKFMDASRRMQDMQLVEALNIFEAIKPILDNIPALYYNLATIHTRLGNFEIAEVEIQDAIRLDTNNLKYLKLYFKILQKTGQFSEAVAVATQILRIEYDPDVKMNKAFLLLRMDEIEDAVNVMEQLLEEGSNYPVVYFTLGVLKYQVKQYEEAEALIREAINQKYNVDESTSILITILENLDRNADAIELLEKMTTKTSNSEFSLAKLYKQEGKTEDALSKVDELLSEEENNIDYLNFKGHTFREAGMYPNAIEMYDQVLVIDSDNLSAIKGKALSLVELDQHEEANELFEKGERLNRGGELPNFDDMIKNLDVIN